MKIIAHIIVESVRSYDHYYSVDLENGKTVTIRVMEDGTSEGDFGRADIMQVKKTATVKRLPKIVKKIAMEFIKNNDQNVVVRLKKIERPPKERKEIREPEYKTGADDIGGVYDAVWWR